MLLYKVAVALVRIWLFVCGWRVIGKENIPAGEAVLVIANHTSYADPVLLAAAMPMHISFIAKEGFYRKPLTRWLYGMVGAVFLNKEESDLTALRASIKRLREGRTVGIFPEGRRNHDRVISAFMPGASYIAVKAGARVLPVAINNSKDVWRFWKRSIIVNIGPPVMLSAQGKVNQQQLAAFADELQQKVTELYTENARLQ